MTSSEVPEEAKKMKMTNPKILEFKQLFKEYTPTKLLE
jgi:hypothetical protein